MEEDLKILEKLVTTKFSLDYSIDNIDKEAIEHLVQAYKQQADIIKNSVSKDKIKELKDFIISDCKQKNIDLIPVSNFIKNINILLEGDE